MALTNIPALNSPASFVSIANTQITLKLTSSNYPSWRLQFNAILLGYDLMGFVDGSFPPPPSTITHDDTTIPNPKYHLWVRQDQLILSAIIGSLSPTLNPFIASATTSRQAWQILAKTYATPSRGRINQLKDDLRLLIKGTQSITEYMHKIKIIVDELALLGSPTHDDDLALKIINGLGDEYKEIRAAVHVRETTISFDELHEKLINY